MSVETTRHSNPARYEAVGDSRFAYLFVGLLLWIFAFAPLVTITTLYAFAWRVSTLIGHWPYPSQDDPGIVSAGDALGRLLQSCVLLSLMFAYVAPIAFPVLIWVFRRVFPRWLLLFWIVGFVLGWILLLTADGSLFAWFFD